MSKVDQLNNKPTPSPKKKTTSGTKTTTTGSTTKKTKKSDTEGVVNTSEIIGQLKDADTIINAGIEHIDRITPKIEKLITKSSKDVTKLRDKSSESGSVEELNAEIQSLNNLNAIKARISRYSNLIRDNSQGIDKRVAFVGIVVPLIESVDAIEKQKG